MPQLQGKIAVFFTGGTIGMNADTSSGGVVPGGNFSRILAEIETRHPGVTLQPVHWSDKPSGHMTPQDMFALALEVDALLARDEMLGAVILHGTDVIVETAFMLDLVLTSNKPVILTGSMRYYSESGYDGLRNLLNSLKTILLPLPPDMGVVLLMNDRLFAARDVIKVNSLNIDAFESSEAGILGYVAGEDVVLTHPAGFKSRRPLPVTRIEPAVPLISCYTGMNGSLVDFSLDNGAKGLVIEGFGAGNVPPGLVPSLERPLSTNIPVVLASRCIEGGVWPIYAYEGGAAALSRKGVILSGRLGGPKSRILLMAALGMNLKTKAISILFS
ncbi:MAG: asparaginase [Proteobacteria bacterium]|nr:asparaginase [Pseudomonadota bacterium]MBU1611796.1 asparaginase [Pseudomonadota bacterium]